MRTQPRLTAHHSAAVVLKSALVAALSTSLLTAPPAVAGPIPGTPEATNVAILEASEASYPILKALEQGPFTGWTELVGKLLFEISPDKLGKSADLLVDVFNSVPNENIATFTADLKNSFAGLKTDSCTLVPLPAVSLAEKAKAVTTKSVDAAKLKTLSDKWAGTLGALSKTDSAICLPSVQNLDKLAISQADLGRSFDNAAVRKFNDYTFSMLKGEVKLTDETFSLLVGAKSQAQDATFKEKNDFQNALKKLEGASKKEKEKQALVRARVENAAKAAAAKATS